MQETTNPPGYLPPNFGTSSQLPAKSTCKGTFLGARIIYNISEVEIYSKFNVFGKITIFAPTFSQRAYFYFKYLSSSEQAKISGFILKKCSL